MVSEITGASIQTVATDSTTGYSQSAKKLSESPSVGDQVDGELPSNVIELLPADQSEKIDETVSQLNEIAQSIQRDLQFSVDEGSGKTVVTVLDTKTKEVIRQIPTEQVLALSENIENLKGILFSAEV